MSITGLALETVIVSVIDPTRKSAFTGAVNPAVSSTPSRLTVLKPPSVNVTVYVPGRNSTIWYRPCPSVTALRTFSIRAGLAASTVTPGSTAPVVSLTSPAIAPVEAVCARAGQGRTIRPNTLTRQTPVVPRIASSFELRTVITSAKSTATKGTSSEPRRREEHEGFLVFFVSFVSFVVEPRGRGSKSQLPAELDHPRGRLAQPDGAPPERAVVVVVQHDRTIVRQIVGVEIRAQTHLRAERERL